MIGSSCSLWPARPSPCRAAIVALCVLLVFTASCDENDIPTRRKSGWTSLGLEGREARNLVLVGCRLYACTGRDGLYVKRLGTGMGWEYLGLADSTLESGQLGGVRDVVALEDSDVLIALASCVRDGRRAPMLYRSENDGLTWERSDKGLGWAWVDTAGVVHEVPASVSCLSHASFAGTVLFVGTLTGDVSRSVDGGLSWSSVWRSGGGVWFYDIQGHPRSCLVWGGGGTNRGRAFLLKSSDGGISWNSLGGLSKAVSFPNCVERIALDPTDSDVVYAVTCTDSVLKSEDGGVSWTRPFFGVGQGWGASLVVELHNSTHLFIGAGALVFESRDGGESFELLEVPAASEVLALEYDSHTASLCVGTKSGVYVYVGG